MTAAPLRIGFLPLLDCAPIVVAREAGFFAAEGVTVELRKAQSWVQLRDWLLGGHLEAAHMLLTMPIQCTLGLGVPRQQIDFAFTLNRRGNGIILGNALWNAGARDAHGLSAWMAAHPGENLRLGVVFPRGTQEYFLRYWLAQAGLHIGERISLSIFPPQEMVGRLRKKEVEGFCVAEPWSRRAAASKLGRIVAESGKVLPGLGDKVLAVKDSWHQANAAVHARILRALGQAAKWLTDPVHRAVAVEMLASKRYINTPRNMVAGGLAEAQISDADARGEGSVIRMSVPEGEGPHHPSRSHVRWYVNQMLRWKHLEAASEPDIGLSRICLEEFHRQVMAESFLPNS